MFKIKTKTATLPENLHLSDRSLPLKLKRNMRAKRLTLRIEAGGKAVCVTSPPRVAEAEIFKFIERNRGWLEVKLAKLPASTFSDQPSAGKSVIFFGIAHDIVHENGRGITHHVTTPAAQIKVFGNEVFIPRRIEDFFKKQARLTIEPLVKHYCFLVDAKVKSIRYKDTKSRWGSCSFDGNLNFSWRIVMAPHPVIQYLVAHEVAHLIEMNHSVHFWKLCEKLCPDAKRQRAWLKRNGQALHAVNFTVQANPPHKL